MFNVQMNSGSILSKEKIGKLTEFIINKLAEPVNLLKLNDVVRKRSSSAASP